MRPAQRLDLIGQIAQELDRRYTGGDITAYLWAYKINRPADAQSRSNWSLVKQALRSQADDDILEEMAVDLGLREGIRSTELQLPDAWARTSARKVFLSHRSEAKDKATRLRDTLRPWGVELFVAHQDISPTLEWQQEIVRALRGMDAFLSLHTRGFAASHWCQQEVGFAVARGVPTIAIRMDEDPVGFQSSIQALSRGHKNAETIAEEVARIWSLERTE